MLGIKNLELQTKLRQQPGVEQTVTFGDVLHVSGTDADQLRRSVEAAVGSSGRRAEQIDTSLEDVFIHLMSQAEPNSGGKR